MVAWAVKLPNSALAVYPGFKVHQRDVSLSRSGIAGEWVNVCL